MTSKTIPDALSRGHILYGGKASAAQISSVGRTLEEQGLLYDAMDFYEAGRDVDGVSRIEKAAQEEGNMFLLRRALKVLGKKLPRETWVRLAQEALKKGRQADAANFLEESGEPEQAQKLRLESGLMLPTRESLGAVKSAEPDVSVSEDNRDPASDEPEEQGAKDD